MARYISPHQRYIITVEADEFKLDAEGHQFKTRPLLQLEFIHGGIRKYEQDIALGHFDFGALPDGVHPESRLSFFDTKATTWDDATRDKVEKFMRETPSNGQSFLEIEAPRLSPPWPNYDQLKSNGSKSLSAVIADKVREDGYDPNDVISYEQENLDRPEVIQALTVLAHSVEEDEVAA